MPFEKKDKSEENFTSEQIEKAIKDDIASQIDAEDLDLEDIDVSDKMKDFNFGVRKEEKPAWAKSFKPESVKASIEAGVILPELKPEINETYAATITKLPELVKSKKGDFYVMEIRHEGMLKSVKTNQSFLFCLTTYIEGKHMSYRSLKGRNIHFIKDEDGYMKVQIE